MSKINATVVADSVNPQGDRLTSLLITFPRILLSEVNTHRMLSKNTSSSRAIPFEKMVEAVQNNPFIPIAWQKDHKGMQGSEYLSTEYNHSGEHAVYSWLEAKNQAIRLAKTMKELGVTKQLCNRLLEPFMWTTMLITGSKEGWNNFFNLRCPQYQTPVSQTIEPQKSWKDLMDNHSNPVNEKILEDNKDNILFKLQHNKGQAEIHIMDLAEKIYDAIQESVPTQLKNEWHIPFEDKINELYPNLTLEDKIKVSVGMTANTSYTIVGDGSIITLEKATRIHDKCKELNHSSVFEHCARAMSDEEYKQFWKSNGKVNYKDKQDLIRIEGGWCYNLKGFISLRYMIDNKINL